MLGVGRSSVDFGIDNPLGGATFTRAREGEGRAGVIASLLLLTLPVAGGRWFENGGRWFENVRLVLAGEFKRRIKMRR